MIRKKTILLAFLMFLFINCDRIKNCSDSIFLTAGLSEDPYSPRFGFEITCDTLFYCEEVSKGKYNYYYSEITPTLFLDIKEKVSANFLNEKFQQDMVDAQPYQLDVLFDKKKHKIKFYNWRLTVKQAALLNQILELKTSGLTPMRDHYFPKDLLYENRPIPPDPDTESYDKKLQ